MNKRDSRNGSDLSDLFMQQRIAIFMDIQSLFYGCRDMFEDPSARVQYGPLLRHIVSERTLIRAAAYLRYNKEVDTHKFHRALNAMGFEVRSKPARDHRERPLSWAMGITFDILGLKDKIDMAVLVTHEEDIADAVPHLAAMGIPVEVWGFDKILPSCLKQESVKFHFIPPEAVKFGNGKREDSE